MAKDDDDFEDDRPARKPRRDEDDDRPARKPRSSRDDDDDDRPARRRRDDDADDYDDAPRRRGEKPDGMGSAAMIIGIISCVCAVGCLVPYLGCVAGPLSVVGGILAIIFGFVGKSKNPTSGKAKTGIITGFIALGIDILMVIIAFALGFGMAMMQQK